MKRFLVSEKLVEGAELRLSAEESKHATRVMRLAVGAHLLLTDGRGTEAEAELVSAEKTGAMVRVRAVRAAPEAPFTLELLQAPLKGARMDWVIEKATELGVAVIRVVDTQFSVAAEKPERWARLADAAMKQSGNLRRPEITEAAPLAAALTRLPAGFHGFLLSPTAERGLAATIREAMPEGRGRAVLAIGPEGGFSHEEEAALRAAGFHAARLSTQILRGETAALTALAVAIHELEFRG